MAHLWVRDRTEHLIEVPIDGASAALSAEPPFVRPGFPGPDTAMGPAVWLCRGLTAAGDVWVLITGAPHSVLVNGMAVSAGIRVLDNRDEIRCPDGSVFVFSGERLARLEPFPGAGQHVRCARCTSEIEPSTPAVRCPGVRRLVSRAWRVPVLDVRAVLPGVRPGNSTGRRRPLGAGGGLR